ncbi:MAG: DNA polymerase Y family protein, partial [Ilumatobacteraceae bacterium]
MATVPRLAVLHCPQWPVVAAGCAPGEPVAVVHANRVVARSSVAAAAGVRVGQRRREAQSRCPELRLVQRNVVADARAFHPVADAVAALVPRLEVTRPGVLTFATRGPSRYFGGDESMASRVLAAAEDALGDTTAHIGRPGIGVADGRFAAGVAARRALRIDGRVEVVSVDASPTFLAPLTLRWLTDVGEVAAEQVDLFTRLGLVRLGQLAELTEPDVLARFGWSGALAHRMAGGLDDRLPGTEEPPPGLAVAQHFDTPVAHLDAVVFTARQLAEQLIGTLGGQGRVCTQVAVTAETEHGERTERLWSMSGGFSVATLVERVRWQLDGWGEPTAGVTLLVLEPTEVRADDGIQLGLWGGRT